MVTPESDDLVRREVAALSVHAPRKQIRRRVRRQVMLRRLQRELAAGRDINTVLRRPFPANSPDTFGPGRAQSVTSARITAPGGRPHAAPP